jgi:hypothetical protein
MSDLIELFRARKNLRQAWEAINSTSMQAKAAVLGSIDQADDTIAELMRKSAKRAVRFGAMGWYRRLAIPPGLVEYLMELAPDEAAKVVAAEEAVKAAEQPKRRPKYRADEEVS